MKGGDEIQGWRILEPIGAGGNATVWKAEHPEHGVCALKVLDAKRPATERYKRFVREVETMRRLGDREGVLPLVAANVPEQGGQAWLAMPICEELATAIADEALDVVIERLAEVAETLAGLAAENIHHRDVKPSNLYASGGQALVGDFGLVEIPDADPITDVAGVHGPRHYVPWEVINNEPGYDVERADVYSLAKTIWVVSTHQRYPLPGPQGPSDPASAISSYTPHGLAGDLDRIIASCTQNDPRLRPPLKELAADLRSLLTARPGRAALQEDPAVLERFAALMRPTLSESERRAAMKANLATIGAAAKETLGPVLGRIHALQPETKPWMPEILLAGWATRTEETGSPEIVARDSAGFVAPGRDERDDWTLAGGFAAELLADGTVRMYAAYAAYGGGGVPFERIFSDSAALTVSSARAPRVAEELSNELVANFTPAVEQWTRLMEAASDS